VEVPNADLWGRLLDLCEQHQVSFKWVRGHAGNKENERCDYLARQAALSDKLAVDTIYEGRQGLIGT
jgi:ribonuclease HI